MNCCHVVEPVIRETDSVTFQKKKMCFSAQFENCNKMPKTECAQFCAFKILCGRSFKKQKPRTESKQTVHIEMDSFVPDASKKVLVEVFE